MTSLTAVLEEAQTAVFVEKWQRIFCGNCFRLKSEHANGKCLFESTSFKPIAFEKLRRFAQAKYPRHDEMIRHIKHALAMEEYGDGTVEPAVGVPKEK